MSQLNLLGLYREDNTIIHRLRAGLKLLLLFILSFAIVIVREAWLSIASLIGILAVIAIARISWSELWRTIRVLLVVLTLLGAYHFWQNGLAHAIAVAVGLLSLILAATVLTATTSSDEMLDTVTRGLQPFRGIGVNPEAVGLAFSLLLRFIPDVAERAYETRDAARARGLERSVRAYLTPLTIRVVARAQTVGEALEARGIGDDES